MLLARCVDAPKAHGTAQGDGQHGQHHQRGQEAAHKVESAEQATHPLLRQRHHQVEREQAVSKGVRQNQDGGVATDHAGVRETLNFFAALELSRIGRGIVTYEPPRQPGQGDEDQAVPEEKPFRGEPPPDIGSRLVDPRKDVVSADDVTDEQQDRDGREGGGCLRKPNDDAAPVSFGELEHRREDDHALRETRPEHEIRMIGPPRAFRMSADESTNEHNAAENRGDGAEQRQPTDRRLARLLDEIGPAGDRDAHRLPPPPPRAFSCRLRT